MPRRLLHGVPAPRLTVVTLGMRDFLASPRFCEVLGFVRKVRVTGASLDAGAVVLRSRTAGPARLS